MMRRSQQRRLQHTALAGLTLPDNWPGRCLGESGGRHIQDNEEGELLIPGWMRPDWATWTRVTLIGRDPLAVTGLRHLLARYGAIRLRVLHDSPTSGAVPGDPDVVVWMKMRHDGLPELAGHVAALRRSSPHVRQLVISDAVPAGLARQRCPLSGVWLATSRMRPDDLYSLLGQVITAPAARGPLRTSVLNRSQWRVLLLRAAGANTLSIAQTCGITGKTVSVRESAIRERLGLVNRVEYAWLLRAVSMIMKAVPGGGAEWNG